MVMTLDTDDAACDIASRNRTLTIKKVSHRHHRWPDVPRYYGRTWIRWAIAADMQRYGYTGVDIWGNVQRFTGRLCRRWSDARRRRNLALIYSFSESLFPVPAPRWGGWFCTLTVHHPRKHSYEAQKRVIEVLRAAWEPLAAFLRRVAGIRYMRVLEAGEENGFCHIHMVIFAPELESEKIQRIPEKWVKICRKIGNGAEICGQNIQRIDSESEIRNVGAYIAKYLTKTLEIGKEAENTEYWRWIEICYRMRIRTVSMDATSRKYIRRKYAGIEVSGVFGEWMWLEC